MTPMNKLPPIPPPLPTLKERRDSAAEYLEMVARLIREGTIHGFDICWAESVFSPPTGKLVVAADMMRPLKPKTVAPEPVDVTDLSDMPECQEPECPACKKDPSAN